MSKDGESLCVLCTCHSDKALNLDSTLTNSETVKAFNDGNLITCASSRTNQSCQVQFEEAIKQQVIEARKEVWVTGHSAPESGWFFSSFQSQLSRMFNKLPVDKILACADSTACLNLAVLLDALIYRCRIEGHDKERSNTDVMFKSGALKALAKLKHINRMELVSQHSADQTRLTQAQGIAQQVLERVGEDKVELYIGMMLDASNDPSMMRLGIYGLAQLAKHDDYCAHIAKTLANVKWGEPEGSLGHKKKDTKRNDALVETKMVSEKEAKVTPPGESNAESECIPPGYKRLLWALGSARLSVRRDSASLMALLVEDADGTNWITASAARQIVTIMKEANDVAGALKEANEIPDFETVFHGWSADSKVILILFTVTHTNSIVL